MSARVLVIGLDATEATLLEKWAAEGELPNIARLTREGAIGRLDNPMETLPGAIWPEIVSGRSGGKTGLFYHPAQIHTGEAVLRWTEHDEVDPRDNYWSVASEAGRRVCVIDQVQAVLNSNLNGVQVLEWALHDRTFGERCHPAELMDEINARYGPHPVRVCNHYENSDRGHEALLDDLVDGASKKQQLALDLMAREDWDLFACTLSETHCVGHHFWHYFDETSPHHRPDAPRKHRNAIKTIYRQADETMGKLIEAAGSGATVLVVASHGMGPSHAGYQMLPEILVRLGMGSGRGAASRNRFRRTQFWLKHNLPRRALPAMRALSHLPVIRAMQQRAGSLRFPLESAEVRAAAVPNNRVGGIRLNLKGRDPFGSVAPGNEAIAIMEELRTELQKLEDPKTGEPIVERVITANEVFGPDHHPDIPDVMVVFRTGHGAIEACRSDRIGLVEVPYFTRRSHRTGDHTVESRLWVAGPDLPAGVRLPPAHVLDIAPTILKLLDVAPPQNMDGRPIKLDGSQAA